MIKVISVTPHNNYLLQLRFNDNAVKFFDVKTHGAVINVQNRAPIFQ